MQENTERTGDRRSRMEGSGDNESALRINVWRLAKRMLLAMVIPCAAAIVVDVVAGTWPFVTLVTAVFAFPVAGFLVMRTALQELQSVIEQIAPQESDQGAEPEDQTDVDMSSTVDSEDVDAADGDVITTVGGDTDRVADRAS